MNARVGIAAAAGLLVLAGLAAYERARHVAQSPPLPVFSVHSALLSAFFHRPTDVRASILLPPSYASSAPREFPAVYVIHAFGGTYRPGPGGVRTWRSALSHAGAEFALVFLDASQPAGHNGFADSANDGPWASALVDEFIPALERRYRLAPQPGARFVTGHSSGGWAALWLQVRYPGTFGGAWASAPDPVDFHDFLGPDLTRPGNFYADGHGKPYPFVRVEGRDRTTLRRFVETDARAPNPQITSFEAVYSPRGPDGRPVPLFDRATGRIDPGVAAYWETHYDLARRVREVWPKLGPQLRGRIRIVVGAEDTFHLDGPVRRLRDELAGLGAGAQITIAPGFDHFSLFDFDGGLIAHEVREMAAALHTGG